METAINNFILIFSSILWEAMPFIVLGAIIAGILAMQDVNHTFRRGHRIMVQIQSTWFPLTDRNPQTFLNIPDAKPSDFVEATQHVYHGQGQASGIETNVLVPATVPTAKK